MSGCHVEIISYAEPCIERSSTNRTTTDFLEIQPGKASVPVASGWIEQAILTASDAQNGDRFGYFRAIDLDGDTIVVGDYFKAGGGAVYVYVKSGVTWVQQQKIVPADLQISDFFGFSVAISGNTIVIGAYGQDNGVPASNYGAAYVYTRTGTTWTQEAKLVSSVLASNDTFGRSVDIDGDYIVVGATQVDTPGFLANAGAAYIFVRNAGVWTEQQKLVASDRQAADQLGRDVSIYGDTVAIGADEEDGISGFQNGAVYIFTRSGSTWTEQQKLVASDTAAFNYFGANLCLYQDSLIVGAIGNFSNKGAAYIFTRSGSTWTEQQKLIASDAAANDNFGSSVAIYGNVAVIGAPGDDDFPLDSGSAYVFTFSSGTWTEEHKLVASDATFNGAFGASAAMDGNKIIIGGFGSTASGVQGGAVYVLVPG